VTPGSAGRTAHRWIIAVGAAAVLGLSCRGGTEADRAAAVAQMQFAVDPSLLGPVVTDSVLRFTFRPPAVLAPAESALVRRLREEARRAARPGDPAAVEPAYLFAVPSGGALCRVGRFLEPPPGRLDPIWVEANRNELERQITPAKVTSDLYRVGRRTVVAQFHAASESMVLFRLLCQGPGPVPFQIDYVVPIGDYPNLSRAIESSIGSLETF
jgi:hypothetical protein